MLLQSTGAMRLELLVSHKPDQGRGAAPAMGEVVKMSLAGTIISGDEGPVDTYCTIVARRDDGSGDCEAGLAGCA